MAQFTLDEILKATKGTLLTDAGSGIYPSVSIDSRTIDRDELFIAIKGKNFDGHDFVVQSLMKGAGGAIISDKTLIDRIFLQQDTNKIKHNIIIVEDTLMALHGIANYHRKKFNICVIGITGSNGKSTSKEMSASVVGIRFNLLKNEENLNNLIGLPLTILKMNDSHKVAILEMGMSERGEIEKLSKIAEPDIGLITNAGRAHLKQLGSIENIRDAKWELIKTMRGNGIAILNSDDPLVMEPRDSFKGKVITFGINQPSDVMASDIEKSENYGYHFILKVNGREAAVNLSYPGYHNIYNALSASAVGNSLGMDIDDIARGIESFKPLHMRMEQFVINGGITVINDAYNANPASTEAAIKTLSEADFSGRKFFVIGDMLELGEASRDEHKHIGRLVASLFSRGQVRRQIDYLITMGTESKFIFQEAISYGMPRDSVYSAENFDEAALVLDDEMKAGDCVMVKGSRGMKMENVVGRIIKLRERNAEDRIHSEEDVCLMPSVF